jgi:H+-transporting ATPase
LTDLSTGLTACEARARLEEGGWNAVVDVAQHPLRRAVDKLWAPVPWMLEVAILLQLGLGDYVAAGVVALLLLFNAALGFFQEGRAQATLDALRQRRGSMSCRPRASGCLPWRQGLRTLLSW